MAVKVAKGSASGTQQDLGEPPVQHGRPSQPKPGLPFSKSGQEAIKRHKAEREAKAKAKSTGTVGEEAKPKGTQKVCCVLHGWRGVRADTKAKRCRQRPLGVAPRCDEQRWVLFSGMYISAPNVVELECWCAYLMVYGIGLVGPQQLQQGSCSSGQAKAPNASQGKPRQAKAPVAAATHSSAHMKVEDEGQRDGSTKHPSAPSPSAPTPAGCAAARNTMVTKKE